jgi:hypothetical protein
MTPEIFEKRMGEVIILLLSVAMLLAGCYYIYCGIEFVLTH